LRLHPINRQKRLSCPHIVINACTNHVESNHLLSRGFNQANDHFLYRREFLSESKRLGDAFTQSLEGCGIENSCCGADSHFSGAIGLVKSGKIRCVEVDSFDFYLKLDRPFCAKPERLMVSSKIAVPGEQPSGRQWVARAGRTSFEVWEKSGK
jgi:hypothetical protein